LLGNSPQMAKTGFRGPGNDKISLRVHTLSLWDVRTELATATSY
jgi:hypothetical protein